MNKKKVSKLNGFLLTGMNSQEWLPLIEEDLHKAGATFEKVSNEQGVVGLSLGSSSSAETRESIDNFRILDLSMNLIKSHVIYVVVPPERFQSAELSQRETSDDYSEWLRDSKLLSKCAISNPESISLVPYIDHSQFISLLSEILEEQGLEHSRAIPNKKDNYQQSTSNELKKSFQYLNRLDSLSALPEAQGTYERLLGICFQSREHELPLSIEERRCALVCDISNSIECVCDLEVELEGNGLGIANNLVDLQICQIQEELELEIKRSTRVENQSKTFKAQKEELREQLSKQSNLTKEKNNELALASLQINQLQEELDYVFQRLNQSYEFDLQLISPPHSDGSSLNSSVSLLRYL